MLLRSVTRHIREQNWFAVVLDFLIVVVGVFIGIEVANWNEAHADKKREREYIAQIILDLEEDLAMTDLVLHQVNQFDVHADYLEKALATAEFSIEDPDYFALSVARAGYTRFPVFSRNAIDELISVGGLTLLRDSSVKREILDYYDFADDSGQWNDLLREQQIVYKRAYQGLLSREIEKRIGLSTATFRGEIQNWEDELETLGPERLGVNLSEAEAILAEAKLRPQLYDSLSIMAAIHVRLKLRAELIQQRATDLKGRLEHRLERS